MRTYKMRKTAIRPFYALLIKSELHDIIRKIILV